MDSQVTIVFMLSLVGEASISLGKHIFDWSFRGYVILILLSTSGYLCHFIIAHSLCILELFG